MKFTLYKQLPKPPNAGITGTLSIHDKIASLFVDDIPVAKLKHPEIIFVNQDGMMLRGYEPDGYTKSGVEKFAYQEWVLRWRE